MINLFYLFVDSFVVKISSKTASVHRYDAIVVLLSRYFYLIDLDSVPKNRLSKYYNCYVTEGCLSVFCFNSKFEKHSYFVVYARKEGVYIEIHGFVQYTNCFTLQKLQVLHLLYTNYTDAFSFSRLDIAIDIRTRFENVTILNKKYEPIAIDECYSSPSCHYYKESNQSLFRRTRVMKCYDKTFQKTRGFMLPFHLTRIEVTIKRAKLKLIDDIEGLFKRVRKELKHYHIFIHDDEVVIDEESIRILVVDLFQVLQNGTNRLYYSNIYKNIKNQSHKARLSYECFKSGYKIPTFARNNDISTKTLRKNINFFRRFKQ